MKKIAWNRVGPGLALILAVAPVAAEGFSSDDCPSNVPVMDVEVRGCDAPGTSGEVVQGTEALSVVSELSHEDLPQGWSRTDVVDVVTGDELAYLDAEGDLFFAEESLDIPNPTPGGSTTTLPDVEEAADLATALNLHTAPGALRTIFLDFTGHTTTNTGWNNIAGGAIVSAPFDLDGSPSTFSTGERRVIRAVWQMVAEDYAAFDVDVTTADPGLDMLIRSDDADQTYGVRVIISPTNWYSSGVGGVAYVGSFNASTDTPVFIFSKGLSNVDKYMAEAAAHEVGHSVGLRHDGTSSLGYYSGHGAWAPIMGVGYDGTVTQWSKGEYADANNHEDDLVIMSSYMPTITDDHGDDSTSATPLTIGTDIDGTIGSNDDVDAFTFEIPTGRLSLLLRGAQPSPDLDALIRLYDESGVRVASANPASSTGAVIDKTLPAGRYTLTVDGVGTGDPYTGWSDYASLGRYTIVSSVQVETPRPPNARYRINRSMVLTKQSVTFDGTSSIDPDGTIVKYRWTIGDRSSTGATLTRTWRRAGTYTVKLTVTDATGLKSSTTKTVEVVKSRKATVDQARIAPVNGSTEGRLSVRVVDGRDHPVESARVTVRFSATSSTSSLTDSKGNAVFTTPALRSSSQVSATVTDVRPPLGYLWDGRSRTATFAA